MTRTYRPRLSFSTARRHGSEPEGRYLIMREDAILMHGRTFAEDDAEAICEALEEAEAIGAEESLAYEMAAA